MEKEKRNAWKREYRKRPEIRRKETDSHREYLKRPEVKERVRFLQRERYKRLEVRERIKNWDLKKTFGISLEAYQALLESQNGKCIICDSLPIKKALAVDHNHITGKIRGLLCQNCNLSLGFVKEDINVLEKMILYIKKFNN